IKGWYEEQYKKERKIVEDGFKPLQTEYSICFPDKIYNEGMLSYYPIIIEDFDMTSNDDFGKWLVGCIPFADASFDYLVTLCTDDSKKIKPVALQVSKQMLSDAKKAIELNDTALFEELTPLYPVNITSQMLNCFQKKYSLLYKDKSNVDALPVGDIAEELWVYSTLVTLLTAPEDADYLEASLNEVRTGILDMRNSLEKRMSDDAFRELSNLCDVVLGGQTFDNREFNLFVEKFTLKDENI
ncbi:MAG: hypothetical protein LBU13_08405, partial [Synergistaceae bacterium]|nr:hypothetical protein [Synergistaceae bacterium]